MTPEDAATVLAAQGLLTYEAAVAQSMAYIRKAEKRYAGAEAWVAARLEGEATSLYNRSRDRGNPLPWDHCLRRASRNLWKETHPDEQSSKSVTEYKISEAYSSLAIALAAGAK